MRKLRAVLFVLLSLMVVPMVPWTAVAQEVSDQEIELLADYWQYLMDAAEEDGTDSQGAAPGNCTNPVKARDCSRTCAAKGPCLSCCDNFTGENRKYCIQSCEIRF